MDKGTQIYSGKKTKISHLQNFLGNEETVEKSYKNFNATNKRLIITNKHGFQDIAYKHITTLNYEQRIRKWLLALGILFLIGGIISVTIAGDVGLGGLIFGIILIILSVIFKIRRYVVYTSGSQRFFIPGQGSQTDAFLKTIREHID